MIMGISESASESAKSAFTGAGEIETGEERRESGCEPPLGSGAEVSAGE